MSELRRDPISGHWVVLTPEHTRRPTDFSVPPSPIDATSCPFCEGREHLAGPELLAWRPHGSHANAPGWDVRVVPNREPALRVESELSGPIDGLYTRLGGLGAHEVIIESPRHTDTWSTMTADGVARVLWAWRERMRDLERDFRLRSFLVAKNHGASAGARLEHPHSQLLAFPMVPPVMEQELAAAARHFEQEKRCIFCDVLGQEVDLNQRVIAADDHAVVLAPFASRLPFEMCLLPRVHAARFEAISDALLLAVATRAQDAVRRLDRTLANPPFNLVLHTAPAGEEADASFHWHIEMLPRLRPVSGVEWGSGVFINPVPPEEAAQALRSARRA